MGWRHVVRALATVAVVVLVIIMALAGRRAWIGNAHPAAFPVLVPVYEIEAVSGTHEVKLPGLNITPVGVPQVPVPVDINGDLVPDVTVSVGLVNVEGVFRFPPQVGKIAAPTIEINRVVTAPLLTPGGDPLRIGVKLRIVDANHELPDLVVRYGYDTGPGGTIPPSYKAVVNGIDRFFNPLEAVIDTTGGLLNAVDPNVRVLGPKASAYEGPLTTYLSLDAGTTLSAKADLRFESMPDRVQLGYATDMTGQHFDFVHDAPTLDLGLTAALTTPGFDISAVGRLDRVPGTAHLDVDGDLKSGTAHVTTVPRATDALPDLNIVANGTAENRKFRVRANVESIPTDLALNWLISPTDPPQGSFTSNGQGIGAIEADIGLEGTGGTPIPAPFVPHQRQYVAATVGQGGFSSGPLRLQARVEKIRSGSFRIDDDGRYEVEADAGDGVQPLEVHADADLRADDLPKLTLDGKVTPLPSDISVKVGLPGGKQKRAAFDVAYKARGTADLDAVGALVLPGEPGTACGEVGVLCGEAHLRHLPSEVTANVGLDGPIPTVAVDAIPAPGDPALDGTLSAILRAPSTIAVPAALNGPIFADATLTGLPAGFRLQHALTATGARLDAFACTPTETTCPPGTAKVTDARIAVRTFADGARPADIPAPAEPATNFATATIRPATSTGGPLRFEATARASDLRQVSVAYGRGLVGKVDIASGKDFRALADVRGLDVDQLLPAGTPPLNVGAVNLDADIAVPAIPTPLTFCAVAPGHQPGAPVLAADLNADCEGDDLFRDGASATGPLAISYTAPSPFDVTADVAVSGDVLQNALARLPVGFPSVDRATAHIALRNVPSTVTALVGLPAEPQPGADGHTHSSARALVRAPGANNLGVDVTAAVESGKASCIDPASVGTMACLDVHVAGLPEVVSVLADIERQGDQVLNVSPKAATCDLDPKAAGAVCRDEPGLALGTLDARVRLRAGQPASLPVYLPPVAAPQAFALANIEALDRFALDAGVHIDGLSDVAVAAASDGVHARANLAPGSHPLVVHGALHAILPAGLVARVSEVRGTADLTVAPVPTSLSADATFSPDGVGPATVDIKAPIDIDANLAAQVFLTIDGVTPKRCGDFGSACAQLNLRGIPGSIRATLDRRAADGHTDRDLHVTLDHAMTAPANGEPNIEADLITGAPIDVPVIGGRPLRLHAAITDIPKTMTASITQTGDRFDRVRAQGCDLDTTGGTCRDTESPVGRIDLRATTFIDRPLDLPRAVLAADQAFSLVGRGTAFEAAARVSRLLSLDVVPGPQLAGAHVRFAPGAGPTDLLAVDVDVKGLVLADAIELPQTIVRTSDGDHPLAVKQPTVDLASSVSLVPFPNDVSLCLALPALPAATDAAPAAEPVARCRQAPPDAPDSPLLVSLAMATADGTPPTLDVDLDATLTGRDTSTDEAIDPIRATAAATVHNVPTNVDVAVQPPGTEYETIDVPDPLGGLSERRLVPAAIGPLFAHVTVPGATVAPDLDLAAALLVGNQATCEDPRHTVLAVCLNTGFTGLPTDVKLRYDPDALADEDNLTVDATGPASSVQFDPIHVSVVSPDLAGAAPIVDTDTLIADVSVAPLPLPVQIRGRVVLPRGEGQLPTIVLRNDGGPLLPATRVQLRNYTAPDPLADLPTADNLPSRPVGTPKPPPPLGPTEQHLVAVQRGANFRVDASIDGVRSFGVVPAATPDGTQVGVTKVDLDFAHDQDIRAYLDLQPSSGLQLLVDALVEQVPANLALCVRAPAATDTATATPATWCGSNSVPAGHGAVELTGTPRAKGERVDADVYARLRLGADIVSGRLDVDDIPETIRATFPIGTEGVVDLATFGPKVVNNRVVSAPSGISAISAEVATFDLSAAAAGYDPNARLPFSFVGANLDDVTPGTGEFVHFVADAPQREAHLLARLGGTDPNASHFDHLHVKLGNACAVPTGVAPANYPRTSTNPDDKYVCALVEFDDLQAKKNPLGLDARITLPGDIQLKLREAALSDIPPWVQVQLAAASPYVDPQHLSGWRPPCLNQASPANCAPPLVRFDQPLDESDLSGVAEISSNRAILDDLDETVPRGPAPDFDSIPAANRLLIKARYDDKGTITNPADDAFAARVPFRIPIPRSITVDQLALFHGKTEVARNGAVLEATADDVRFHFAARDGSNNPWSGPDGDGMLGTGAVFVHEVSSDAQLLLTAPCPGDAAEDTYAIASGSPALVPALSCADGRPTSTTGYRDGFPLPSEIGLTAFLRSATYGDDWIPDGDDGDALTKGTFPDDGKDRVRTSTFLQLDGRVSVPFGLGARLLGSGADLFPDDDNFDIRVGDVELGIANIPAAAADDHTANPSFRVRTEIDADTTTASLIDGLVDDATALLGQLESLGVTFVPAASVEISQVSAGLDLAPSGTPARQIDLVIHTDGLKLGVDLRAEDTVGGGNPAEISLGVRGRADQLDGSITSKFDLTNLKNQLGLTLNGLIDSLVGAAGDAGTLAATAVDLAEDFFVDRCDDLVNAVNRFADDAATAVARAISADAPAVDFQPDFPTDACDGIDFDGLKDIFTDPIPLIGDIGKLLQGVIDDALSGAADALEAAFNAVPLQGTLRSRLALHFALHKISDLRLRINGLHVDVQRLEGADDGVQDGSLDLGGLNWYVEDLNAGWSFNPPDIPLPSALQDLGFPSKITFDDQLLLGLSWVRPHDPFDPIGSDRNSDNQRPFHIQVTPCGAEGLLPWEDESLEFRGVQVGEQDARDFYIWPFADGRIEPDGLLVGNLAQLAADADLVNQAAADLSNPVGALMAILVERLIGQEVLCGDPLIGNDSPIFPTRTGFEQIRTGTDDPDLYNPGNSAASIAFPANVVPGQTPVPDSDLQLQDFDRSRFIVQRGFDLVRIPTAAAVAPTTLGSSGLCGIHRYPSGVVVTGTLTVGSADPTVGADGKANCADADVGRLTIIAPTIEMQGHIEASAVSAAVSGPGMSATSAANLVAPGASGGNNGGAGHLSSEGGAGSPGPTDDRSTEDDRAYTGSPGGSVADRSAGDGGLGGGAVVLRADDTLVVTGSISADGSAGAGSDAGACDTAGTDGFHGAGGGAGGAIVLTAGRRVDATGAVLSAAGGAGGQGRLGAGGGGGGGVIKVRGPIVVGADEAGLAGAVAGGGDGAVLCTGFAAAPHPAFDANGQELPLDGFVSVSNPPRADLRPVPEGWHPDPYEVHVTAAGQPGPIDVYVCAAPVPQGVTVSLSSLGRSLVQRSPDLVSSPFSSFDLAQIRGLNGGPADATADAPCGTVNTFIRIPDGTFGGRRVDLTIAKPPVGHVQLDDADGVVETPVAVPVDFLDEGALGLWTVAVVDGVLEPFDGIETVANIDPRPPTVSDLTLAAVARPGHRAPSPRATAITTGRARVTFVAADQDELSGLATVECQVVGFDPRPFPCVSGDVIALPSVDDDVTIRVTATDRAGNRGSAREEVRVRTAVPPVTIAVGPAHEGEFVAKIPVITLSSTEAVHGDVPFAYRLDDGFERECVTNPCAIPSAELELLGPGRHVIHATAVSPAGIRNVDDADPLTPSPMTLEPFAVDLAAPFVAVNTLPSGGLLFSEPVTIFPSAVDHPDESGVSLIQFAIDAPFPVVAWTDFDPNHPPVLSATGLHRVCSRAVDHVGHWSEVTLADFLGASATAGECRLVLVDAQAPTVTITRIAGGVEVRAADEGVGLVLPVLVAVDDQPTVRCDAVCPITSGLATEGLHTISATAVDAAGNHGNTALDVLVDTVAPELTGRLVPVGPTGANGWFREAVVVELGALDATSGVAHVDVAFSSTAPLAPYAGPITVSDGATEVWVAATDAAGNVSARRCVTELLGLSPAGTCSPIRVDRADPTVALTMPAVPASGWFAAPVTVGVNGADASPGAGLTQPVAGPGRGSCLTASRHGLVAPGVCVSVDGGPFVTAPSAGLVLGDGLHRVRAFAVDGAGRRSAMATATVRVDLTRPVVEAHLLPPAPARNGWYRETPIVALRADDGAGSGVQSLRYRIDSGPWTPYTVPFPVPDGIHTVAWQAADLVGTSGGSQVVKVDRGFPTAQATTPAPNSIRVTASTNPTLQFVVGDDWSGALRVGVVIYDGTGIPIRRLDAGTIVVTPGTTKSGSIIWDGKDSTLQSHVPVGVYYYRVVVTDEAGNTSHGGESAPLTFRLL